MVMRFIVTMFSAAAMTTAGAAYSQDYPSKPIRIITPGLGGGTDLVARLLAHELPPMLGQQIIVDNRPSAAIAGALAAKAQPDGYSLIVASSSHWLAPYMQDNLAYDPIKDFAPVTMTTRSPNVLVVHPSVAANSTKELIALAKARPGELKYSSALTGGSTHLSAELFKAMAGVNIVRIAYKGSATAFNDLVAGQTQLMFATVTQVGQFVKSGRLRALAITTAQPSPLFPGLPTVAATIPGYESTATFGVFAPAKTPAAIVNRLNRDIARMLNSAEIKEKFTNIGVETIGSTPAELAAAVKAEMTSMGKVIKDASIRAD